MKTDFSKTTLSKIVSTFHGKRIIVFGDIMLDYFIRGKVERISPEAPVPVVKAQQETYLPGGAGNVASNIASLGAEAVLVAIVGDDIAGKKLLYSLKQRGINISKVVMDARRPTTEKVRIIADHQQVVRFDRESSEPLSHGVQGLCFANFREMLKTADAVILSDYKKGVISTANIKTIVTECRRAGVPVCVDPKVEHLRQYKGVTCITPNTSEAWHGMSLHPRDGQENIEALGEKMLRALRSDSVLITQGPNGMTLFEAGKPVKKFHIPTAAREVFDVTGAGDTVISVFTLALASGATLPQAAVLSNFAAGIVVGKLGTATVTKDEILKSIK